MAGAWGNMNAEYHPDRRVNARVIAISLMAGLSNYVYCRTVQLHQIGKVRCRRKAKDRNDQLDQKDPLDPLVLKDPKDPKDQKDPKYGRKI